jgi:hypothetical protein
MCWIVDQALMASNILKDATESVFEIVPAEAEENFPGY